MAQFKDRIIEIRTVKASELTDNEGNWRVHPSAQKDAMVGILNITDDEADKMLLVYDPISAMAEMDGTKVIALTDRVTTDDLFLREVLRKLEHEAKFTDDDNAVGGGSPDKPKPNKKGDGMGPMEMELMPFEHYDYLMLAFRDELSWLSAVSVMHIERKADARRTGKIGLCRVLDGKQVVERIIELELELAKYRNLNNAANATIAKRQRGTALKTRTRNADATHACKPGKDLSSGTAQ